MYTFRPMTLADYDALIELLGQSTGVVLRGADSRAATARYLERNPGLSCVCIADAAIVGCLMAGHDGRRGYLQHLAVHPEHRRRGIASRLVERCVDQLARLGIAKVHIDVLKDNAQAAAYWQKQGWTRRSDIDRYSLLKSADRNA